MRDVPVTFFWRMLPPKKLLDCLLPADLKFVYPGSPLPKSFAPISRVPTKAFPLSGQHSREIFPPPSVLECGAHHNRVVPGPPPPCLPHSGTGLETYPAAGTPPSVVFFCPPVLQRDHVSPPSPQGLFSPGPPRSATFFPDLVLPVAGPRF